MAHVGTLDRGKRKHWASSEIKDLEQKLMGTHKFHGKSQDLMFFVFMLVAFVVAFVFGLVVSPLWFVFSGALFSVLFVGFALFAGLLYLAFIHIHSEFEAQHHVFLLFSCLLLSYLSMLVVGLIYSLLDSHFVFGADLFEVWFYGAAYSIAFTLPYAVHWLLVIVRGKK